MTTQQAATIQGFANLSGSFLLFGLLVMLVAGSAVLWLTGRGLNLARREAGRWAPQLLAGLITLQTRVDREAEERFIRPHFSRLCLIVGVRAGVIAFWRGRPSQV